MKHHNFLRIILIVSAFGMLSESTFAQFDVRAGMGIGLVSTPSVVDYINQNYTTQGNQLGTFNTAVIFSVEGDYDLSNEYQIGIEMAYLLNSYTYFTEGGKFDLSYGIWMPSIIGYYVLRGTGYNFKFGAGAGVRFTSVNETKPLITTSQNYTSTGFGILLRADGNTLLGGNFYANIGGDIRYDINGEPKNNNYPMSYIVNPLYNENVNFNALSFTLRLGITYQF
jgi:hypothetical protein